jgi:spermidine synthase
MDQRKIVAGLFLLSGFTGLVYETVWIRAFALSFGSTAQALSTVAAVYLGGLAIGAWLAGRLRFDGLKLYGIAEILTGAYALAIPSLISLVTPWLASIYSPDGSFTGSAIVRAICCAVILAPATIFMGATLPFLASWSRSGVSSLYAVNLIGAAAGAFLSGFALLPSLGFEGTLRFACALNIAIGIVAVAFSRRSTAAADATSRADSAGDRNAWAAAAFFSGFLSLLYEVVWGRISGLLFGPTASTVTLVLGTFLLGLAIAAILVRRTTGNLDRWLITAQAASIVLLCWAFAAAGLAPDFIAGWVSSHTDTPGQIEWMKVGLLLATLTPLAAAAGLVFPLMLRVDSTARRVGTLYGINTLGCIVGSLATGWLFIPLLGTQATVFVGGLLSAALGLAFLKRLRPALLPQGALAVTGIAIAVFFLLPRWKMEAMTAGVYKYAPYAADASSLTRGEVAYLREGVSGTVVVRKDGGSTILSIDGKVDATDAGGDLLTEKLLAHIPLLLSRNKEAVCLIGLASGVTAGAALTHPIETLDVLEVSKEVAEASHYFDAANGAPLQDPRTRLLLNDGRNHLLLTSSRYDVIISEPSNPWIAGMNSLFTRDFFRIAKSRLRPGGLFAQWFHIYNMPGDDLRSLLSAFHEVFPTAALWRLNDGDVLLTGMQNDAAWPSAEPALPAPAKADLLRAGVDDPALLWNMFVIRDADIARFAGAVPPNTDDRPWLEFHGQRDLHAQTDFQNADDLEAARTLPDPPLVAKLRGTDSPARSLAYAKTFERAESFRSAYKSYESALKLDPGSMDALAGMDRCARLPRERAAVAQLLHLPESLPNTQEKRTEWALQKAREGDVTGARFLFAENAAAHPTEPAARFNFGVFSLEQKDYRQAIDLFQQTITLDPTNIPAHEAIAEANLKLHDYAAAADWSRRILKLNPDHATARQILAALERGAH